MSNDSIFFLREGRRVQSTLLHLDGDVEKVVVALTPANRRNEKRNLRLVFLAKARDVKRLMLADTKCSHCLSFFPRLSPDVDAMATDQDCT